MSSQDSVSLRSDDDQMSEVDGWVLLESQMNKVHLDKWVVVESQTNKVWLRSSDDEMFVVDKLVAFESQTLKSMIENNESDTVIPLPNVTSRILAMVIQYCTYHMEFRKNSDDEKREDKIKQWDVEFVNVDQATLYELILAAKYLNIKNLLELACRPIVDMLKEKSPQEIMATLGIKRDFKHEEEMRRMIRGAELSSYFC